MTEEIINFGLDRSCVGIYCKAPNTGPPKTCVILLNAGIIHKVGPNMLHVNLARSLVKIGIESLRFDFSGTGDSDFHENLGGGFDEIFRHDLEESIEAIIEKYGEKKFVLFGICSGAQIAYQYSLRDLRISGVILIDGLYVSEYELEMISAKMYRRMTFRYYRKFVLSFSRWQKLLRGQNRTLTWSNILYIYNSVIHRLISKISKPRATITSPDMEKGQSHIEENNYDWDKLLTKGTNVYLIFCEGGIAWDVFNTITKNQIAEKDKSGLWIELVKDVDHTFTPVWTQNLLCKLVANWLLESN